MSITRLDISLEQYEIGVSGAVPERAYWSEPAMDRAILEFVSMFCGIVFKYGGRIVHGCHPAFTPIILRQARLHGSGRQRPPVTLVMSDLWAQDLKEDDIRSMLDIAEFIVTKRIGDKGPEDTTTRNQSLTAMRRVMVNFQNVIVAVGGLLHRGDGIVPGVEEEVSLARERRIPQFLIGGLGGLAKELTKSIDPSSLNNSLSDAVNLALFRTDDIGACVNLLFAHLASSQRIAESVNPPVKWNSALSALVDHRDGTIDSSTQLIARAFVS